MYDYISRWYDYRRGRFVQADTIVPEPGNPQSLNRFSYVGNNPVRYADPTGMFTEDAVYQYILNYECGAINCADQMIEDWSADSGWWLMLMSAEANDMLYGMDSDGPGTYQFYGEGTETLTGLVALGGQGRLLKLSSMLAGEYPLPNSIIFTLSADWEALQYHDTGYVVTKAEFYGVGEAFIYGSQYMPPDAGSVIRAATSGAVQSAVETVLTSKCGSASAICDVVGSGVLAGIQEALRIAPNEQGDEFRQTAHWTFLAKPDRSSFVYDPDISGRNALTYSFAPPTIRPH